MSKADVIFQSMCNDIIEHGTTTKGQKVRPHWEDGASAYTIKRFGVCNRYDLREEFPALTSTLQMIRSFYFGTTLKLRISNHLPG